MEDATPAGTPTAPLTLHNIHLTQHQDSRYLLDIRPSPGKGLGLFANAPIPRGTRIIAERALLPLPIESCHTSDIMTAFSALTPSEKEFFLSLHSSPASTARFAQEQTRYWFDLPPLTRKVIEICRTNGSDGGVFFASSRLNHSCVPNVFTELNRKTMVRTFHTIRSVEKGEELTVSYTEVPVVVKAERQANLKGFGFTCECSACEDSAEGRRLEGMFRRLCELKKETEEALLEDAWGKLEERARWMVKRMESEGFLGAELCQR